MSGGGPTKPIESYPKADLGDLPMPPQGSASGAVVAAAASPAAPRAAPAEVAALLFLDAAAVSAVVALQFGFMWEGQPVTEIPVHRLTGAEVGQVADDHPTEVELFDFYAKMSGYPKTVLRGLIDDDLEAFLKVARPFLCPFARENLLSPIGESGAPSPAAPAAPSGSPGPAS